MFSIKRYEITMDQWLKQGKAIGDGEGEAIVITTERGKPVHAAYNEDTNRVDIWFLVNVDCKELECHLIWVVGTGWNLPIHKYEHISTIVMYGEGLFTEARHVFHVLEELR